VSPCSFILVGGIERFIVLVGVEAMAERLKLDSDLRQRLEDTEAYLRILNTKMGKLPTNFRPGRTQLQPCIHDLSPMGGEFDEWHNDKDENGR
jgi:hypothetical protein